MLPLTVVVNPSTFMVVSAATLIVAPFILASAVAVNANEAPVTLAFVSPFIVVVAEVTFAVLSPVAEKSAQVIVNFEVADTVISAEDFIVASLVLLMPKVP